MVFSHTVVHLCLSRYLQRVSMVLSVLVHDVSSAHGESIHPEACFRSFHFSKRPRHKGLRYKGGYRTITIKSSVVQPPYCTARSINQVLQTCVTTTTPVILLSGALNR